MTENTQTTVINDEAVHLAEAAAWAEQAQPDATGWYCAGTRLPDRVYRAALEAALPALLPDRNAVFQALRRQFELFEKLPTFPAEAADEATGAIFALINPTTGRES